MLVRPTLWGQGKFPTATGYGFTRTSDAAGLLHWLIAPLNVQDFRLAKWFKKC